MKQAKISENGKILGIEYSVEASETTSMINLDSSV